MPIHTAIWKVADSPVRLKGSSLSEEKKLESMIVDSPGIVSDELMLVGRQVATGFGGCIDLLGLAPDASLVLIELKKKRTPRDVVAQALDYATWVEGLREEDIVRIYEKFSPDSSLPEDFKSQFDADFGENEFNQNHQIIIVASSLDDSTERIVAYLQEREIPISVLCFQVFSNGSEQLLSRTWLHDPIEAQVNISGPKGTKREPWNEEFYCNFGLDGSRKWEDAKEYGFICGGGGAWYSRTLKVLNPDDRVWVNVPKSGFVGVGLVTGQRQSAKEFKVKTSKKEVSILEAQTEGTYDSHLDDPEKCEYFVPI